MFFNMDFFRKQVPLFTFFLGISTSCLPAEDVAHYAAGSDSITKPVSTGSMTNPFKGVLYKKNLVPAPLKLAPCIGGHKSCMPSGKMSADGSRRLLTHQSPPWVVGDASSADGGGQQSGASARYEEGDSHIYSNAYEMTKGNGLIRQPRMAENIGVGRCSWEQLFRGARERSCEIFDELERLMVQLKRSDETKDVVTQTDCYQLSPLSGEHQAEGGGEQAVAQRILERRGSLTSASTSGEVLVRGTGEGGKVTPVNPDPGGVIVRNHKLGSAKARPKNMAVFLGDNVVQSTHTLSDLLSNGASPCSYRDALVAFEGLAKEIARNLHPLVMQWRQRLVCGTSTVSMPAIDEYAASVFSSEENTAALLVEKKELYENIVKEFLQYQEVLFNHWGIQKSDNDHSPLSLPTSRNVDDVLVNALVVSQRSDSKGQSKSRVKEQAKKKLKGRAKKEAQENKKNRHYRVKVVAAGFAGIFVLETYLENDPTFQGRVYEEIIKELLLSAIDGLKARRRESLAERLSTQLESFPCLLPDFVKNNKREVYRSLVYSSRIIYEEVLELEE